MSVNIVMPQMGESIAEGTISKWLKKVGDTIEKDEAVLEISTDKVDAEVPSPAAGSLLEIRHQEGETVEVGTVVAVVGDSSSTVAAPAPVIEAPKAEAAATPVAAAPAPTNSQQPTTNASDTTEVVMPQMGESIAEGTVSKWLKKVGDDVERDEPLLEISTDKVDAEVPSPVAGKLLQILHGEGETVEVGKAVGLIGAAGTVIPVPVSERAIEIVQAPVTPTIETVSAMPVAVSGDSSLEDLRKVKSSPLVRNIAKEHGVDLTKIPGSGIDGRVTKNDILGFIESGAALKPSDLLLKKPGSFPEKVPGLTAQLPQPAQTQIPLVVGGSDRVEPMSVMRKKIAEHMRFSKATSAHVTSVYEIDMTAVAKFRDANKAAFQERFGTKLTFMPFIFQAVNQALRRYPVVNSQIDGENIVYKADINLGIAVALDWGLIVPVIKKADTLSLSGLCLAANDLAERARAKKLKPDEVHGGTFTITNTGTFGGLFGTPIINQPQVAILNFGTIEKRPKVITTPEGDDYIAIRQQAYFALTYDHRIVDGADAERFLSSMKRFLETNSFSF